MLSVSLRVIVPSHEPNYLYLHARAFQNRNRSCKHTRCKIVHKIFTMGALSLLTKANLEGMIKEPIASFLVKEGSKKGDNVAGEIHSVVVQTKSGKTLNLVYKVCPDDNPMLREYVIGLRIFNIEIAMYTKFRPAIEALLKAKTGTDIELPFPTYYGGLCDGVNDFLCLGDLRPEGYIMPDKFKGLNYPQMNLTIRELAKFHAYTYFLIKHEGESIFDDESVKQYVFNFLDDPQFAIMAQGMFGGAVGIALKVLEKTSPELAGKFREFAGDAAHTVNKIKKTSDGTDTKYFPVIIHGDFWMNNFLFKYEGSDETKPIGIKFLDFQMSRRGNIFEELQYLIFTSTTPAFRKEYLSRVLDTYYDTFTQTVEIIKCPKPQGFTKGFFIDNFYDTYESAICFLPYALPLQLGQPQEPIKEKPASPLEQMELMQRDMLLQWEQSPRAIQRMESILREFQDLKIL